ncbi:YheC/YheD family endospore coat-associated protein [Salinithrix halophila]|uniref:YheC/YheD family protein n=1 Tax=Salinithrix halophila TaxID=1485204 RepID=A0ABV8JD94_9BACL
MNGPSQNLLGVIVCRSKRVTPPFQEAGYFKQLAREGKPLGIEVIVFCPMDVDWSKQQVIAWKYNAKAGQWIQGRFPLPPLIYDRCYYTDSRHYLTYKPHVVRLANHPRVQLLGRPLGGKLTTQEMLSKNPILRPYLPPMLKFSSPTDVQEALHRFGTVLIKPNGGSHGRGVAAIWPDGDTFRLKGRSLSNQTFRYRLKSKSALTDWINHFVGSTRYVIQPCLALTTVDGHPFDLRILVQKDGRGNWVTTGMAIRSGAPNTLTSNLHGGGKAEKAVPFIQRHFPKPLAEEILTKVQRLALEVPRQIEREHGRLLELGLDIGIDRKGRVWLLEANSKPGRSVFLRTGEKEIRRQSVKQPMLYAHTLFQGLKGGSV